jgi:hypothetical protein
MELVEQVAESQIRVKGLDKKRKYEKEGGKDDCLPGRLQG